MTAVPASRRVFVVLGNQLFPPDLLPSRKSATVFMAEDSGLCTRVRHHQQKIVMLLAAMRAYRDELVERGFHVDYFDIEDDERDFEDKLRTVCEERSCDEIVHFEIEGKTMERRLENFARDFGLRQTVLPSPMFLCDRGAFADFLAGTKTPRMASFYKRERKRLQLMVTEAGEPAGGRWSLDAENRKKLPKAVKPPIIEPVEPTGHVRDAQAIVQSRFADHPGRAEDAWLPTTRPQALAWLDRFIAERLESFGDYEDAMTTRSATVFHSVLSPMLNNGLLTPNNVIERTMSAAASREIPLNSLEGFVRQVIGWREFVRGIYQNFSSEQHASNFWNHHRTLTPHWYDGTTGIPPLDDTIKTATQMGWTHHIPRLMVAGNLMTLAGIAPREAHRWFMEMYVDSANWVMGPNVYGMGLFSDGGLFATKPYICGSNYLLKMSDYRKGDWCDTVDGLYWRFIDRHADFFEANPRLALMTRALGRLKADRRTRIFAAAERFIDTFTGEGAH